MGKLSFDDRNGFFKQMLTKLPPERAFERPRPLHCATPNTIENYKERAMHGKAQF